MRTIFINGRFLGHRVTGVERYGREVLKALDQLLDEQPTDVHLEVLVPPSISDVPLFRHFSVRQVGHFAGHVWEQIALPLHAAGGVLFTPAGGAPLFFGHNVITIHDVGVFAAPTGYSRMFRVWYRLMYRVLAKTARQVMTVSQFSKTELVKWLGADPAKIVVAYPGCEQMLDVEPENGILKRLAVAPRSYVLAVGSRQLIKNLAGLAAATQRPELRGRDVVVAGQSYNQVFAGNKADMSAIKEAGYVSDGELRSLYENAGCFVFPSFYEGFGLPPIEALRLGCPVVVSNVSAMPEVCGEVAQLCDPNDPEDIAAKVLLALRSGQDEAERRRFAEFASRYTYRKCAAEILDVLLEVATK